MLAPVWLLLAIAGMRHRPFCANNTNISNGRANFATSHSITMLERDVVLLSLLAQDDDGLQNKQTLGERRVVRHASSDAFRDKVRTVLSEGGPESRAWLARLVARAYVVKPLDSAAVAVEQQQQQQPGSALPSADSALELGEDHGSAEALGLDGAYALQRSSVSGSLTDAGQSAVRAQTASAMTGTDHDLIVRLSDSQDMYLQAAGRLFVALNMTMHELEQTISAEAIPYLLLSIHSDTGSYLQHPVLLYCRSVLRKSFEDCWIPPTEEDRASQCCRQIEAALDRAVQEEPSDQAKHQTAICEMIYELVLYYIIVDRPDQSTAYLALLRQMLLTFGIMPESASWLDVCRLERIEQLCDEHSKLAVATPAEPTNLTNLLAQADKLQERDLPDVLNLLIDAAFSRTLPIHAMRVFSTTLAAKSSIDLAMLSWMCNAVSIAFTPGKP
ncbi:hypothetical protein BC831DRAFT_437879 [Entophlyctis helioformis]|nr:hypothetical protein BC831DRAFT_437879 [Entophlyctis helioformis]